MNESITSQGLRPAHPDDTDRGASVEGLSTFRFESVLPVGVEDAFAWHACRGAFERLSPPWQDIDVIERDGTIRDGDVLVMRMRVGPVGIKWVAEHFDYEDGRQFGDRQLKGPFRFWEHRHRFEPIDERSCRLTDDISYRPPLGRLGALFGGRHARKQLQRVFAYRHDRTRKDLEMLQRYQSELPQTIAITGASGLVGSSLTALLLSGGHRVVRLVRRKPTSESEVQWDADSGIDPATLQGIDAVVHLAGESLASGRWTRKKMAAIRDSRVEGTRHLAAALANMDRPPSVLVSASAIGYYGDRGEEPITESGSPGSGFLADVVRDWENATAPASDAGVRVCLARLGVVLSPTGGALKTMLPAFKLGGGGPIGNGKQMFSWVSLDDAVGAILHMLFTPEVSGPVNVTSPNAVTNRDFARTLGRVLRRPAFMPLPGFAARAVFGKMADEILLSGANIVPQRLRDTGYAFLDPDLEPALRRLLGRLPLEQSSSLHHDLAASETLSS